MAKFLTTNGNVNYIEELIKDAKSSLTLVTPYLSLTKNFINRLIDADLEGIKITLIYGKEPMKEAEKKKLFLFKNLEIYFCSDLHAKCYHNNEKLIITSMNLYEFSEKNNREMGVLFDSIEDSVIFKEALREIKSIINSSAKEKSFVTGNEAKQIEIKHKESKGNIEKGNEINAESSVPRIEPYYSDINYYRNDNFYFPALAKIVTKNYVGFGSYYNIHTLTLELLRKHDINIILCDNRMNFEFADKKLFDKFEAKYKVAIKSQLKFFRIYWNYKKINIYLPKNYEVKLNNYSLMEITDNFFLAIKTIVDLFKTK
jgi:hypothetical protein